MGKTMIIKGADFSENAIRKLAIDCNSDIESANYIGLMNGASYADVRYANLYGEHLVIPGINPT